MIIIQLCCIYLFLLHMTTVATIEKTATTTPKHISSNNIITMNIQPTAKLVLDRKQNNNNLHRKLSSSFITATNKNNAIYSSFHLEDDDENDEYKELLLKFNKIRNKSRYEIQEDEKNIFQSINNNNTTYIRSRRLQPYTFQNSPLLQGFGTHYVTAWVGTPPQRKSVIVDTGSHYTAFPCKGCHKCGEEYHTDKYFDPGSSSTFRPLSCGECIGAQCNSQTGRCEFAQSYTEGSSWQAYQVIDRFFVGQNKMEGRDDPVDNSFAIEFMFGCQTSEQGLFVTQLADGIMGMSAHDATFPKQLYNNRKLSVNQFSLCFGWELSVSKDGINSGILTLGGIDTRLHLSPMVYAKNMVLSGWYTVYVKNVFLRKGGGISAASPPGAKIIKLPIDVHQVNSGKGVIVDSGTTDTYLSKSLEKSFLEAWKSITGMKYTNSALRLSAEEVKYLPTLMIQLSAFEDDNNDDTKTQSSSKSRNEGNGVGLAGELDPKNPRDVIIAVSPTHYMEYTPNRDTYTSRLYFTESRGGVIGANAMQGHDVLFDWENGRVGFAESSCVYNDLIAPFVKSSSNTNDNNDQDTILSTFPDSNKNSLHVVDCTLSNPAISSSCIDSIDISLCDNNKEDDNTKYSGLEKLVWVIEKEALNNGKSCEDVLKETLTESNNDDTEVTCTEQGLCYTVRSCQVTCSQIMEVKKPHRPQDNVNNEPLSSEQQQVDASNEVDTNALTATNDDNKKLIPCGDNTWGACTSSCIQSKVISYLSNDGTKCLEASSSEQEVSTKTRPCHIHACLQTDPCRVPFLVHAIFGLGGIHPELWTSKVQDSFIQALAYVVGGSSNGDGSLSDDDNTNDNNNKNQFYFGPGDVNVLMRNPWTPDLSGNKSIGVKLIVEISIFNPNVIINKEQQHEQDQQDNIISQLEQQDQDQQDKSCNNNDLYIYAKTSLDVHTSLQRTEFLQLLFEKANNILINNAIHNNNVKDKETNQDHIFGNKDNIKVSKVLTSWTIKTEVGGRGTVHDHSNDELLKSSSSFIMKIKNSFIFYHLKKIFVSIIFIIVICIILLFVIVHYRSVRNDSLRYKVLDQILSTRETNPFNNGGGSGNSSANTSSSSIHRQFSSSSSISTSSVSSGRRVNSSGGKTKKIYTRSPNQDGNSSSSSGRYTRNARSFQL